MKYLLPFTLLLTNLHAEIPKIDSFEADFTQTIVSDKGNELHYYGHVLAAKPQYALWQYLKPVVKEIYITKRNVTIIEPEIEQVIIRNIHNNFDFFSLIQTAKEIKKDTYITILKDIKYTIKIQNNNIASISYKDEFENSVIITFEKQSQNGEVDLKVFSPIIPLEYDIIQE